MFRVRKMKPNDFPVAVALTNTEDWDMRVKDFEVSTQLEPEGCFVLFDGQKLIGLVTCISYGKIGWFGDLVIRKTYRKQGAGSQLVNYVVDYLKRKGATTIGIYGYPYLTKFYGRLGFKSDVDFVVLKTNAISETVKPKGNLKLIEQQQASTIVDFDAHCFGGCRKKVLMPILEDPHNVSVAAVEGEKIIGYIAAKAVGKTAEIGPLICSSTRRKVAAELLEAVLSQLSGKSAYLYVRASEGILLDVAYCTGFKKIFSTVRMFLGSAVAQDWVYMAESLERG